MNARKNGALGLLAATFIAASGIVPAASASATRGLAAMPALQLSSMARVEARLGSGEIKGSTWRVSALEPGLRRRQPCLESYVSGGPFFNSMRGCHRSNALTATGGALVMKAQGPAPADESLVTAVGVILAPTATELEATFADGQTQTIQLHRLSARAARRIGSIRFRTAAFAVRGEWCPTQLTSRSPGGNVLWTSQVSDCADALGAGEVVEGVS